MPQSVAKFRTAALDVYRNAPLPTGRPAWVHELSPNLYMNDHRLHLTIAVMNLLSDEELTRAFGALDKARPAIVEAIGDQPLVAGLRGLRIMRGSHDECKVLYADVEDDAQGRLRAVSKILLTTFFAAGLLRNGDISRLKLHATLANVAFLSGTDLKAAGAHSDRGKSPRDQVFDAQPLLQNMGNWDLGQAEIHRIQIARMGSVDPADGSYVSVHEIEV
ncbi:hypothetical protein IWQ60_008553 [Tieghemiomyces parasiticus]|uniref:A-kinase anchor protein 7-like phosphoesterase domain-containing protein n=1 Tax=Tieghemiomyces parasiticus TaxID=78921 RepID=A0A9W8DRA8_9FUNG|nr:hypothetical protein IWQ60_008553 [Tieghemiomyces parasiticus]